MGTEGVEVFKGVDLLDCELERDGLVGVYWDVIGGWGMGSLADIQLLYNFLESDKFFAETKTGGIPCLSKASFTIDR